MDDPQDTQYPDLRSQTRNLLDQLQALAQTYADDPQALLLLLRLMEQTHTQIRENLFQAAIPNDRHAFQALMRTIETTGGWPYIPRMRLQAFLSAWDAQENTTTPLEPEGDRG